MNAFLWESINRLTGRLKNPACAFRNHYKGKGSKKAETSKYMRGSGRYADVFPVKEHRHADCRLQTVNRLCRVCRLSVIFIYLYLNFSRWTLIEVINTSFPLLLVTPPCIIYVTQGRGVWPGLSIVSISWFATT